jgi:predicted extracellular nuclease
LREQIHHQGISERKIGMRNKVVTVLVLMAILMLPIFGMRHAVAASHGDVVINEFTAKGTEWIELYNLSTSAVSIEGWMLTDGEDDEFLSGSITAGGYFVIDTSLALSNTGDEIQLYNGGASLVDEVAYGTNGGAPLPPFGTSTARSPNGADTDDFARDWNVDQTPTRAAANDGPGTDLGSSIILNEQNAFSPGGDFFELYNPTDNAVDLSGWQASDGDDITTLSGSIPSHAFVVFTDLSISSSDVMYLWDENGVRIDQLGRDGEFEDGSFQRLPDGVGPNDGYDFESSGGGNTYFDCVATPAAPNGTEGCFDDAPIPLTIPEIQGDGQWSPYVGEVAITTGVVTLLSANGRDMWIQDPAGDGDPATSDGIFVDDRDRLPEPKPVVGDLVQVMGQVEEQQFGNALPLTRLDDPDDYPFEILSNNNPLPVPVPLTDLPNESIPAGEGFWEPLEGMLVSVENAFVVAPTNRFGEFAMLTEDDANADLGSGYFAQTKQILLVELSQNPNIVDYNPERIAVDDASLDEALVVMPGDRVRSMVGVVDYTFSMYKLQPASFDIFTHDLPNLPASTRSGPGGNTVITTFNVENLFDLVLNTPEVVDSFGRVGENPGSGGWFGGGIATANHTLRRKSAICSGDSDPSDTFDPSVEWDGFPINTFDGLGSHSVSCGTASGLFVSEYIEGSSFNKSLEIYNGTGSAVNLGSLNATVQIFFNGSTSAGQTISLSGTLADGDVYVLSHPSADSAILAVTDQTSGGVLFNGNDAITLNIGGKDDAGSTPTPEELEIQLAKLALAIEVELRLPEIIVVQEIENQAIAQELADLVNSAVGTAYMATSFETSDGRGIEAGFLWDDHRVDLMNAFQMSGPGVSSTLTDKRSPSSATTSSPRAETIRSMGSIGQRSG